MGNSRKWRPLLGGILEGDIQILSFKSQSEYDITYVVRSLSTSKSLELKVLSIRWVGTSKKPFVHTEIERWKSDRRFLRTWVKNHQIFVLLRLPDGEDSNTGPSSQEVAKLFSFEGKAIAQSNGTNTKDGSGSRSGESHIAESDASPDKAARSQQAVRLPLAYDPVAFDLPIKEEAPRATIRQILQMAGDKNKRHQRICGKRKPRGKKIISNETFGTADTQQTELLESAQSRDDNRVVMTKQHVDETDEPPRREIPSECEKDTKPLPSWMEALSALWKSQSEEKKLAQLAMQAQSKKEDRYWKTLMNARLYTDSTIYFPNRHHATAARGFEFRLLEVKAKILGESILCKMHCTSLKADPKPSFIALSYAWGSNRMTHTILVNGHEVHVTANLHQALYQLRRQDESVLLWADAICINQQDVQERNHQVSHMTKIYSAAQEVVSWLGEGTEASDRAMELIAVSTNELSKQEPFRLQGDLDDIFSRSYWSRVWVRCLIQAPCVEHMLRPCHGHRLYKN